MPSSQEMADHLVGLADEHARQEFLNRHQDVLDLTLIETLKSQSDSKLLQNAKRALQIAQIATQAAASIPHPLASPLASWAQGNALLYLGRYQACLDSYEQAFTAYAQHGSQLEAARLKINQIPPLQHLGRYEEAKRAVEQARKMLAEYGPTRYSAILEMNAGNMYHLLGDYGQALAAYERGRETFLALGDPIQAARMDINRARSLEGLDQFDQAERLLEAARDVLAADQMQQEMSRADLNLGALTFRQGRYQVALQHLERSHDGFRALDNDLEVAVVNLYRAHVYLALNLMPEALSLANASQAAFEQQGMKRQMGLASVAQGIAHRGLGDHDMAIECFDRGRRTFRKREARVEVALIDLERAELHRLTGNAKRARRIARRAEKEFESHGLAVRLAQSRLVQAWCALDMGQPDVTEMLARSTLETAERQKLITLIWRAYHVLGRVAETEGRIEAALEAYTQALKAIEALQSGLWVAEFRATFLQDKLTVYEHAVRLALDLGQVEQAFELVERAMSIARTDPPGQDQGSVSDRTGQDLLEELRALRRTWHWKHSQLDKLGDIESETDPERSATIEAQIWESLPPLEAQIAEQRRRCQVRGGRPRRYKPRESFLKLAQESLNASSSLIQYYAVGDQLLAFVVRENSIECVKGLGAVHQVVDLVDRWRFGLQGLKLYSPDFVADNLEALCRDAQVHLGRLYDILVRPLLPLAAGEPGPAIPQLYVSAPIPLNGVPFAALFDGNHYLIENLSIVHLAGGVAAGDFKLDVSALLSVGFSDRGRLPFAVSEAEHVAGVFDGVKKVWLLTEEAATRDDFNQRSQEASLIHLATHAAFRADNPFFSWLRLTDAHLSVADLCELEFKHYPQVTLSACETALSSQRGGGFVSPVWALMAAGAGAVVASLWKVHDASTADLMACFYEHLMAGLPAATALRAAQLKIKEQSPHPLHWAGFTLVQRGESLPEQTRTAR